MTIALINLQSEHLLEYKIVGSALTVVDNKYDTHPSSYLEYAKGDLEDGQGQRNIINAVGNAKRAFHFQVELIADAFAWKKFKLRGGSEFHRQLAFIASCGVLSPNILKKLNSSRNKVEHQYHCPSLEEARDYIDVVELFLMATKPMVSSFPEELDFELFNDEDYDPVLDLPPNLSSKIELGKGALTISSKDQSVSFEAPDPNFLEWLSAVVSRYVLF